MAVQRYYADDATLTLNDNAGTPAEVPVASLKGVTITMSAEHVTLFSGDSIEREDVKKRQLEINVEISVAAFDTNLLKTWAAGDSTETAQSSIVDTSDVALYGLETTFESVDGGTTLSIDVDDIYFPEMPAIDTSEGEYVVKELSGVGKTISDISEA